MGGGVIMQNKWTPLNVIGLLIAIIGLACIVISCFQEGNRIFLNIGLLCTGVDLLLFSIINFSKRNK